MAGNSPSIRVMNAEHLTICANVQIQSGPFIFVNDHATFCVLVLDSRFCFHYSELIVAFSQDILHVT